MEFESLDGYQICHVSDNPASILKEKRIILRMTQQQVADKARITLQQYQKFESGSRSLRKSSFETACKVIEALGMDINDFYHGEYTFGEVIIADKEGLKYKKTGRSINEEIE